MFGYFRRIGSKAVDVFLGVATVSIGTFLANEYVGGFVICNGPSMQPTIRTQDILLTDHISPRYGWIDKGDIIVARSPINNRCICKRVVAVAGDHVLYRGQDIKVPQRHIWLEGDNKDFSWDSRDYGPVPLRAVKRRCICKLWPKFDINFASVINYHLDATTTITPGKEINSSK